MVDRKPIRISPQEVGSGWRCPTCDKKNIVGLYPAIHMREGLDHTCSCGHKSLLQNWKVTPR